MTADDGTTTRSDSGLDVDHLSVSYGGNRAVHDVNLSSPLGRVTGLIGPNGAGKTTTFNACSGLLDASAGSVSLFGVDVTHRGPAARARMGLGRTFQVMNLVNAMTVERNVALGAECQVVGTNPLRQVFTTRSQARSVAEDTEAALERCGLAPLAGRLVGTLSTGQRRLVEFARVLAGRYRMLLLDEPSSGLDEEESEQFGEILRRSIADEAIGILLVEHDIALVMAVCDHIYVLDFGELIFEGTPASVQASEAVQAAYLGDQAVEAIAGGRDR